MKIGIDARLLERKITGIGRSLIILLENLPAYDQSNEYYLFSYDNLNFNDDFYKNISTIKPFIPQKIFSPLWSNFILPYYLRKYKIDVLFSVNQIVPLIKVKGYRYISVVHDVIFKADKNFIPFIYRKYLQLFAFFSLKVSDVIITVSEYSKHDIIKHYKIESRKIKVVLQSANKKFKPMNLNDEDKLKLKNQFGLSDKVVLFVGMLENRKNIRAILKVADMFFDSRKDLTFLLVGKIGYGGEHYSNSLAKAIIELLEDDQLRLHLGNNGLKTAKDKYYSATNFSKIFDACRKLLN